MLTVVSCTSGCGPDRRSGGSTFTLPGQDPCRQSKCLYQILPSLASSALRLTARQSRLVGLDGVKVGSGHVGNTHRLSGCHGTPCVPQQPRHGAALVTDCTSRSMISSEVSLGNWSLEVLPGVQGGPHCCSMTGELLWTMPVEPGKRSGQSGPKAHCPQQPLVLPLCCDGHVWHPQASWPADLHGGMTHQHHLLPAHCSQP